MNKNRWLYLLLILLLALAGIWALDRVEHGIVIASAHSKNYSCTIRELPHARNCLAQFFRVGVGTKVYLCEVKTGSSTIISSCGFAFAGSFIARKGAITIHETQQDNEHDGFVEFDIDGYRTRCDFRTGDGAEWKKL